MQSLYVSKLNFGLNNYSSPRLILVPNSARHETVVLHDCLALIPVKIAALFPICICMYTEYELMNNDMA